MNTSTKLSVITINYNNRKGLKKTVDSVVHQSSRSKFEYLIIDGGSTDGSKNVLNDYSSKIDCIVSEHDNGIYNAMNKGVNNSHGEYCLFINSGDELASNDSIENLLIASDNTDCDFVIGKVLYSNTGAVSNIDEPITMNRFYNDGSIPHPATLIRRQLLIDNPYDESLRIVSDWKFFIEELIIKNRSYKFIDQVISVFDGGGISAINKDLVINERERVLKSLFPERLLLDYVTLNNGGGYQNTKYDNFYIETRKHNISKLLYTRDVLLLKILEKFKKSLRFVRSFPLHV